MPTKPRQPAPVLHVSVLVPGGNTPLKHVIFHSDSIRLTPKRMDLLRRLVAAGKWKRQGEPRQTTWDEIQAAVAEYLDTSD